MTAQRKRKTAGAEEVRLLGLLLSGDIAGFEQATGMSMREMELRMRAAGELADADLIDDEPDDDEADDEPDEDDEDDEGEGVFYFDDKEDDWHLRPEWLHAGCVDPCAALDLGTCCKYPVSPLVRRALELADSADRVLGEAGPGTGDLTRLLRSVPGLLAQVHAVLPSLDRTSLSRVPPQATRTRISRWRRPLWSRPATVCA